MFGHRFFGARFFGARFFGDGGNTSSVPNARSPVGSGYSPERNETQYRISAIQTQTRNPATQTQARPRSALKNNR